jgi:hypothetical protein
VNLDGNLSTKKRRFLVAFLKAVFTLAKFIAIMPATATSSSHHCSCLNDLGRHDTERMVSISCRVAQGGQGKYCFMSLLLTVLLANFPNVNDP